jgi:hypothetical protein
MSSEERQKILQMVADGKISAAEGARLMRALNENAEEQMEILQPPLQASSETGSDWGPERSDPTEFEEVRKRARRFAAIPLWVGVFITVLSAWGMFGALQNGGYNFWFFFLLIPLFLGILLISLGATSATARWLYLNVDRSRQNDWPRHITLAFPLPLGLVSWFLKNFGSRIEGLKHTNVDEVIEAISLTQSIKEPLIVNVEDDEGDGERVQVYIG